MKNKYFLLLIFVGILLNTSAQQIENLRIKPLDNKLNLIYDITHEKTGQLFDVKITCSNDGGASFNISLKSVSGDCGANIEGGKDKIVVWDVLADYDKLKGNKFVFKVVAAPGEIKTQKDHVEAFDFELLGCYKKDKNIVCTLKITNNGTKRDLKLINRLARVYDFKGKSIEARNTKLGSVAGKHNYSAPVLTFSPGQTDLAVFTFNTPEDFSNRIKLIDIGVEIMEITYGLDLKTGNIQFKCFIHQSQNSFFNGTA